MKNENEGNKSLTIIDYELIQSSLSVMRTFSLMPQNKRGRRVLLHDMLENLVDLAISKKESLGYSVGEPIELKIDDLDKIIYRFFFRYTKSKGEKGNKRIHTDNFSCTAIDEEGAMIMLKSRLKKLKENLVEIKGIKRQHSMYILKNGECINSSNVISVV